MVWLTRILLLVLALALGAPLAEAQIHRPCEVLTAAEARAITGVAMEYKDQDSSTCVYKQVGYTEKAPNNRLVWLSIYQHPTPNPNAIPDQLDAFRQMYSPPPLSVTKVTDVGDAALWAWRGDGGGMLFAYSGGTIEVQVWITGLSQPQSYPAARSLALKAFGGGGKTGFAYNGAAPPPVSAASNRAAPAPSAAPAASGTGSRYADAPFVATSDFFHALKEVDLRPLQQISALSRYLPEARITSILEAELRRYGIGTRDGAPIVLEVVVGDEEQRVREGDEDTYIHGLEVEFRFLVPAVALRHGRLVGIVASPAATDYAVDMQEDTAVRKLFFGDHTREEFEQEFTSVVRDALHGFASEHDTPTAWPVSAWTDQQKSAAQGAFESAIRSVGDVSQGKRASSTQFSGLDAAPKISLEPHLSGPACHVDQATWRAVLNDDLRKHGLVRQTDPAELLLNHTFQCAYESGNTTWYRVSDILLLTESNVAYVLNGRIVRGWGMIAGSMRTTIALEDNISDLMAGYLARQAGKALTVLGPPVR